MDVDWIVGIAVFLVFVGWSFSFYFAVFQESETHFELAAAIERDKIIDYISADVYELPVKYQSSGSVSDGVLKAGSIWYNGEKNTTKVFSGSQALPCIISGDELYWQANLTGGENYFTIQTADIDTAMNCSGGFSISSFNLTEPWAFEKESMISDSKINYVANLDYETSKALMDLNQDFRVIVRKFSGDLTFGKALPSGPVTVDSKETKRRMFETSETANITIAIW